MSGEIGLEARWKYPHAFADYEVSRSAVAPALASAIQQGLESIPDGSNVFEIGAGGGALLHYAGEKAGSLTWTESDQNPYFLSLPRSVEPQGHVRALLPDIPVEPGSVDAVVGLGVLDTLSTETVEQTFASAGEALSDGGVIVHLMDLAPDFIAEIHNSKKLGLFPLPFMQGEDVGICYIDLDAGDIGSRIKALDIEPSTARVLLALIKDPETWINHANKNSLLGYLGNLAVSNELANQIEPSWMKHFGERLGSMAEAGGFNVLGNSYIVGESQQERRKLPKELRQAAAITREYGAVKADATKIAVPGKFVSATARVHSFVAQKKAA